MSISLICRLPQRQRFILTPVRCSRRDTQCSLPSLRKKYYNSNKANTMHKPAGMRVNINLRNMLFTNADPALLTRLSHECFSDALPAYQDAVESIRNETEGF